MIRQSCLFVLAAFLFLTAPTFAQDAEPDAAPADENVLEDPTPDSDGEAGDGEPGDGDLTAETDKLFESLQNGDVSELTSLGWDLTVKYGPGLLGKLVGALLILLVGLFVTKWLAGMARRTMTKARVDETLAGFIARLVRYTLLVLVLIMVLGIFGVPVTGFAAVVAAAGFAIGMALSGTLGNFAAGMLLLIFRPFKVGDVIEIAGVTGKVAEIELFTTNINTFDNRRLFVPNAQVYDGIIENKSHFDTRRVDVPVGVSYDADIDQTRAVLNDAIAATEGLHEDPAPQVFLKGLGGSSVDWVLRVWTNTADFWVVHEALVRNIKHKLDAADIGIPYPQMDVHLD
ncbi:MAG: mechanosensitive ion channel domain-containing protein, partial [Planctomycetota bacterium]